MSWFKTMIFRIRSTLKKSVIKLIPANNKSIRFCQDFFVSIIFMCYARLHLYKIKKTNKTAFNCNFDERRQDDDIDLNVFN